MGEPWHLRRRSDLRLRPSFFGTTGDFGHNTVIDLTGQRDRGHSNRRHGRRGGPPFVTGGVGALAARLTAERSPASSSNNQWGWDAGGGVMGYFNEHVGLRGDIRYIRPDSKTLRPAIPGPRSERGQQPALLANQRRRRPALAPQRMGGRAASPAHSSFMIFRIGSGTSTTAA